MLHGPLQLDQLHPVSAMLPQDLEGSPYRGADAAIFSRAAASRSTMALCAIRDAALAYFNAMGVMVPLVLVVLKFTSLFV